MITVLGVDYGKRKIGFAIGQIITNTATPLKVICRNSGMWQEIDHIFKKWQPQKVVVGKPELRDKTPHPLEKDIEKFIIKIKSRYNVNVYRNNEAYTSFEASLWQNKRDKGKPLDAIAAAIILESWMQLKI